MMAVFYGVTVCLLWVAGLLAAVAVGGFLVAVLYMYYLHQKFSHIPAIPRKGFFSGHTAYWTDHRNKDGCFDDMLVDMLRECGPVFHFFLYFYPMVVVLDPDFVKEMLFKSDHRKPFTFYSELMSLCGSRLLGTGLVTQLDPMKHAKRRAMFNPAFHRKYLQSLMGQFNASAEDFIERLSHKADGKTEVAMLDEFNKTGLDVIAKVAFGLELKLGATGDSPLTKAVQIVLQGMARAFQNPFLNMSPFSADRKLRQEVRESIHFLRETGRECIQRRQDAIQKREAVPQDILTYILEDIKDLDKQEAIPMEDMLDEFITFFVAGQETTANLLSFTLLELGRHPEIMHRLRTEVEAVLGENRRVEYSDIGKLDYMMQVFKETLRLWPPGTNTGRELSYDVTVKGFNIPSKTTVLMSTYAMGRMEKFFHDPLQFEPDRFKGSDDKPLYAYFPFSLGSRSCIGQQFAMIEARVVLARLLMKFHFTLVPGQNHGVLEELTLKPQGRCKNYIKLME